MSDYLLDSGRESSHVPQTSCGVELLKVSIRLGMIMSRETRCSLLPNGPWSLVGLVVPGLPTILVHAFRFKSRFVSCPLISRRSDAQRQNSRVLQNSSQKVNNFVCATISLGPACSGFSRCLTAPTTHTEEEREIG